MTPKALRGSGLTGAKRGDYFIKCCKCNEVLAARDFPEHTGELLTQNIMSDIRTHCSQQCKQLLAP